MRLLTEEQKHWVEVIGDFCKKEIEPIMLDWDKVVDPSKAIPFEPYAKAFKLGLNSFEIPKEYGGNKVDLATAEVMYEDHQPGSEAHSDRRHPRAGSVLLQAHPGGQGLRCVRSDRAPVRFRRFQREDHCCQGRRRVGHQR